MDDSMEAFELPSLSKKKLCLSRKRRIISPLANKNDSDTPNIPKDYHNNIPQSSTQNNDTLSGIPDLSDDSGVTEERHNKEAVPLNVEQKENLNKDVCLPVSQETDKNYSPGGFCKICSKKIPAEECKTHYINCMAENFASKKDLKLRIERKLTCGHCGKLVDVKSYQDHCETCPSKDKKNVEKVGDEPVTSSYFKQGNNDEIKRGKVPCPSCHKDLAGRTLSARQSHVNRCLDNNNFGTSQSPNRSTPKIRLKQLKVSGNASQSDPNTCSKCGKTLKTKGGLKRHVQSCTGPSSSKAGKEKRERRKRTAKVPRNAEDEILQVAKALSKSEDDERKRSKREEKLRKKEIGVPVMLQDSPATRKAALETKLAQMIGKSDDAATSTDDCEVPCTPVIPLASKWEKHSDNSLKDTPEATDDLKPFVVLPQSTFGEKGFANGTDDQTDIKQATEIDSANEEHAPVSNKFQSIANSKWGLSGGKSSCSVDYRVSGLLTQFDSPAPKRAVDIPENIPDCPDAIEDKELLYQVIDNNDNVDSTLQQLIELGGGSTVEHAIPETSFDKHEDDMKLNITASDEEDPQSEPIWTNTSNILPETPQNNNNNSYQLSEEMASNHAVTTENNQTNISGTSFGGTRAESYSLIQEDYSKLVNCKSYSDLTLRFNADRADDIAVHKCILLCRMPALLQVFENGSVGGIYYMQRCDREEMLCLFDHIYTGSLKKISKLQAEELYQRLGCNNEQRKNASQFDEPVDSCDETQPHNFQPTPASFVPSDDDLFHDSPVPCSGSIRGGSPTVRLTDFRSRLDESIEIRMDDDETERIYVTNVDSDVDKATCSNANVPDKEFRPLVSSKRRSAHFTPLPGNRHKFRRMTGSTPKSPSSTTRPPVSAHDTPADIHDFSSIASHSPHPNLFNSPMLKPRPCNSDSQYDVRDIDDITDDVMQSQPAKVATPEDEVFVTSFSQPVTSKYKFRDPPDHIKTPADPSPVFDFSVNDSVLLSAAVGHVTGAVDAPEPSNFKTPVPVRKPRRSIVNVPFTPMLNYSDMDTPNIVKQGQKMGLKRTLGKKKLKVKLKELYAYRHQVISSDEEETSANNVTAKIQAPPSDTPTNVKTRHNEVVQVVESDSDDSRPALACPIAEVFNVDSSDEEVGNEGSEIEDLHTTHFIPCATSTSDLEGAPEQQPTQSKHKTKKLKPSGPDELDLLMHDVITNDVLLYRDILRYKPIYLSRFKALLKEATFSCNANDLLDYLDRQGITFTTADERKTNNTRTKKRRKPKKPGA
uniref:Structure-specific endonuclease subunit SLX4 n=1 Tax=Phallusia mammillata TaxID=59560 RepID=A0A6F9DHQ4_9ASCI|nr:uncharacterized protein LOC100186194 [Phallusia mammillata]